MTRKDQLKEIIEDLEPKYRLLCEPYIEEMGFIDKRLQELRRLPFIMVNGRGVSRPTAAAKQFKDLSSTRDGIIRNLARIIERHSNKKKGAFAAWLEEQNNQN